MRILLAILCIVGGLGGSAIAILLMMGTGLVRGGHPWLVALIAVALVLLPARALAQVGVSSGGRPSAIARGTAMIMWSLGVLICFPLYFPGEREDSLRLGLASVEPWTQGRLDSNLAAEVHEWRHHPRLRAVYTGEQRSDARRLPALTGERRYNV